MRCARILFVGAALSLLCSTAHSQSTDSTATYVLLKDSVFEMGCFGPCACPVLTRGPVQGTFLLTRTGADPLFEYFDVNDVKWEVPSSTQVLRITGSGKYRLGGEFALTQELTLDLSLNNMPPRRFDSGNVPVNVRFPEMDVTVSIHGRQACFDTVIRVHAIPLKNAGAGDHGTRAQLRGARPNPFLSGAEVELELGSPGPVDVSVYDLHGRETRSLARGAWLGAGAHSFPWDGRGNDGAQSEPGIYFVRMRADGREFTRAVVKLE